MKRTLRRIRILSELLSSIAVVKLRRQRRPIFVGFYITNRCNLRCSYCFVNIDDRFNEPLKPGFSKNECLKIIDELYALGTRWIFLLGGEPLLHKDIGEIVDHIVDKGILLHILSNGTLIERKIAAIERADGICISIDGGERATDASRGKGTFAKALRGVEIAMARGMTVRLHAVLNKHSLADMESLALLAADIGVTLTVSPPNFLGTNDDSSLVLSGDEYRDFYRRYRRLKELGFPIGNSFFSIEKALQWPIDYHAFIEVGQNCAPYRPIRCVIGDLHGCIDAEGTMFNCIQRGCLDGLNIKDVGLRKAWDELPRRRKDCVSCSSVNTIETSAYLKLEPAILLDGWRFFFSRPKRKNKEV